MKQLKCSCNKYLSIKKEYESYQNLAEKTIQNISERNIELERTLDALSSIVEISRYINLYLSDPNLIQIINDMMLGILGVTYSTIYVVENNCLSIKATNIKQNSTCFQKENLIKINNNQSFLLNSKTSIYETNEDNLGIHSLVGVPIEIADKLLGYIVLEQAHYNFFNKEHIKFLSSIANQIAVVLENSFLYKKIKKTSELDSLLEIYNRKYFFKKVDEIVKNDSTHKFAIVMIDIDNFKMINDTFGHQFGDEVLKQTTKIIANTINSKGIIARYGGEELVVFIYDGEDHVQVYKRIDIIRRKISENIVTLNEAKASVTASFGISFYPVDSIKIEEALSIADIRLYEAKHTGKNKIISRKN
ncbi:sensor domain-containing diguanylate cyclase [Clostridium sp. DJ247]|uniref:sensor domain-containing diguanylate cyclase n=1 Tax=Clostridium sp. DJ247 TaxID=2726188 RepID=UPI0016236295|nr:sensor domain-containing diguanylate cyclase [Clostridium sp. DJ247]MBC2582490.1 sensor domain-containing diguanylate cyclase [Clostridium sp. DJ247]